MKKKVLVLGDSHAGVFKTPMWKKEAPGYEWEVVQVFGATLSGLSNPNSKTRTIDKFDHALKNTKPDMIFTQLGEVDCGYVIWFYVNRDGINPRDAARKALDNYKNLLLRACEIATVYVISAPLPTIGDGEAHGEVGNQRSSIKTTQRERTQLTIWFNKEIKKFCDNKKICFVDLDKVSIGENGLVKDSLIKKNKNDHHYKTGSYINILRSSLSKFIDFKNKNTSKEMLSDQFIINMLSLIDSSLVEKVKSNKKFKAKFILEFICIFLESKKLQGDVVLLIKILREMLDLKPDLKSRMINNFTIIKEYNYISPIEKIILMMEIEGVTDSYDLEWIKYGKEIVTASADEKDFQTLSELINIGTLHSRLSNYNRDFIEDYNEGLNIISKYAVEKINSFDNDVFEREVSFERRDVNDEAILLMIGYIPANKQATHLNLAISFAKTIQKAKPNSKIYFVITGEQFIYTPLSIRNIGYSLDLGESFSSDWFNSIKNSPSDGFYIGKEGGIYEVLKHIRQNIKPSLVFSIGGIYRSEFISRVLFFKVPIVLIPASNANKITFPVSGIVARTEEKAIEYKNQNPNIDVIRIPIGVNTLLEKNKYNESNLGFKDNAFVAAVVLNSNRIAKAFESFSQDDLDAIIGLINKFDNFCLLLIGESQPNRIVTLSKGLKELVQLNRIKILPYVKKENLRGLYEEVDLIFTLPGVTGGGGAVTAAIIDNVPSLSWVGADVSWRVSKEFHYQNVSQMVDLISSTVEFPHLKKEIASKNEYLNNEAERSCSVLAWQETIDKYLHRR